MKIYEKISGFADEIAQELDVQIEAVSRLGIQYIEMRGVDGNNLIYHPDEKVKEIKQKLEDAGIKLSALGSPLGKIGIEDPFEPHFEEFKRACEIAMKYDEMLAMEGEVCWGGMHSWKRCLQLMEEVDLPQTAEQQKAAALHYFLSGRISLYGRWERPSKAKKRRSLKAQ